MLKMALVQTTPGEEKMVDEQTFDWIFFAIVGIPLILAVVELFRQR
jgi:hypothetical protein